jgi:PKD repeat protein
MKKWRYCIFILIVLFWLVLPVASAPNLTETQTTIAQISLVNAAVDTPTYVVAPPTGDSTLKSTVANASLKSQFYYNGKLVYEREIGPGLPPKGWTTNANLPNKVEISTSMIDAADVPTLDWSYGCTATSAAMYFGYYDRNGYPNMYTGPTNGGVFPISNAVWGSGECPLSASHKGIDGRTTKGHVDDYWYGIGSSIDPYYGYWTEHTPQDCVADYMGTNQYQNWGNGDGGTSFFFYGDGSPMYDYTGSEAGHNRDAAHGMRLFAESRGYKVSSNYNQLIYGYWGNTKGFTYDQYKSEIDAGNPVLIGLEGHSMLGVGYSGSNQIIVHDTWDHSSHTMTWGGSYWGMNQEMVTVIHLSPAVANFTANVTSGTAPLQVSFSDLSSNSPTGWAWYFGDETFNTPWMQMTASAEWARIEHTSVVMPDGSIVLMGGLNSSSSGSDTNDVWRSTDKGVSWTQMTAHSEWSRRFEHTSVVVPDGSIVLMGGTDWNSPYPYDKNDVWRSMDKGATWTQMTAHAEWAARFGHTSVALPDGSIVIMGGSAYSDGKKNDVWRSADNGVSWTQMTASAEWSPRLMHTSVVMPDGSIVLMGGSELGLKNDVWRSTDNGATWTQMAAHAEWAARFGHTSVVMPDGSIMLMGGSAQDGIKNDMWRSTDNGDTWTQVIASAEWSPRYWHSSVVLPDSTIVLMGGLENGISNENDVWRFMSAGSSDRIPSHTYTKPGIYNVALQAYNTGGYNSTRKVGYITVTSPATPTITVTSPNGGESWQRGTSCTVTWDYAGNPGSFVKIILVKGGVEVGTISANTSIGTGGHGSCKWPIYSSGSTGYDFKVSVQSISQSSVKDMSNNNFNLTSATSTPSITVTSPNGGEVWQRGISRMVTWDYTGSPGSTVKIMLVKGSVEVGTIASSVPIGSNGHGSYTWPIYSSGSTGSDYKVSVQSISQPAINDMSNSNFALTPAGTATPTITVTSPNGGETWQRGNSHTVTWSYTGSPGSFVKIVLLKAGAEVETINPSTSIGNSGTGSYTWPIPSSGITGSDFKIKVQSISQPVTNDMSNSNFVITSATTTPSITVTVPNGGETWQRGTSRTIAWDYTGNPGSTVKITLLKAGSDVGTIIASTSTGSGGKGSYTWPISATGGTGSDYKVKVQSISQPVISDTSNNNFNLTPATTTPEITVTSPNGGETWKRGTSKTITWSYAGSPGSTVKIVLLKGSTQVGTISASTSIGTGGIGSYTWQIYPTGGTGSDYKVSIESLSHPTIKDSGNNYFKLTL